MDPSDNQTDTLINKSNNKLTVQTSLFFLKKDKDTKSSKNLDKNGEMSNSNKNLMVNANLCPSSFISPADSGRKKISLGRGYSLMDWIRFTKENRDVAGNNGILRRITYEELALHNKENDCWMAIYGKEINIS